MVKNKEKIFDYGEYGIYRESNIKIEGIDFYGFKYIIPAVENALKAAENEMDEEIKAVFGKFNKVFRPKLTLSDFETMNKLVEKKNKFLEIKDKYVRDMWDFKSHNALVKHRED